MSSQSNNAPKAAPDLVRREPELPPADADLATPDVIVRSHGDASSLAPVSEQPARDIYQESLRALRGRYPLAIVLAVIGAALGAVAGFLIKPPLYRSESLLRIAYTLPPVMKETDQNQPIAMFEGYVKSQVEVMQSQRVLGSALDQPGWRAMGRGSSPAVMRDFIQDLSIEHPANTDYLRIAYEDPDAAAAAAAVNALVDSYKAGYEEQESARVQQRLDAIEAGRKELDGRLTSLRQRYAQATAGASLEGLQTRYKAAVERASMLDSRLADVELALQAQSPTTAPTVSLSTLTNESVERLARTDSTLRGYLDQRRQFEQQLERAKLRYGAGDQHPEVVEIRRQIADLDGVIERYTDDTKKLALEIQTQLSHSNFAATSAGSVMSKQTFDAQKRIITRMREETSQLASECDVKYRQAKELNDEEQQLRDEIAGLDEKHRMVELESHGGGRLSIISRAEVPVQPFYNPRKKYCAAGAAAGAVVGPGLLVLFALLNGKYRLARDTEYDISSSSPLLTILPNLSSKLTDLMEAADVAQSIHQLRVTLQAERNQRKVLMITSACSGEGKTSLAVAMALSFAAAGTRTLLIDCDLVGQGVTRGFGLEGCSGVREALSKNTARGSVKRMVNALRLMPAGNTNAYSGWTVSPYDISRLLREVRPYYETILIDTGPILGSIEACVLAPEVDGVVMAISRGQQRSLVDRALQQLVSLGAKPAGFVFNRARKSDFSRSAIHSSARTGGSSRPPIPSQAPDEPADFQRFGPIVRAVAMFMPQLPAEAHSS